MDFPELRQELNRLNLMRNSSVDMGKDGSSLEDLEGELDELSQALLDLGFTIALRSPDRVMFSAQGRNPHILPFLSRLNHIHETFE